VLRRMAKGQSEGGAKTIERDSGSKQE